MIACEFVEASSNRPASLGGQQEGRLSLIILTNCYRTGPRTPSLGGNKSALNLQVEASVAEYNRRQGTEHCYGNNRSNLLGYWMGSKWSSVITLSQHWEGAGLT